MFENEMNRYDQGFWSVEFPKGWTIQDNDFPIAFIDEDGDWAIQISHYLKECSDVTDADLEEFIADMESPDCVKNIINTPNMRGVQLELIDETNMFWRQILLCSGQVMLYITYSVNKYKRQLAEPLFQNFIESIKIKGEKTTPADHG